MNLRTWLKKQDNENKIICLGGSSSYFWFGTVKRTLLELKLISDREKRKIEESRNRYAEKVRFCERRIHDAELIMKKEKSRSKIMEMKKYIELNGNMINQINMSIEELDVALNTWINIADREVIETFGRDYDKEVTAVIISGFERGNYWCLEEWKRSGYDVV